MCNEQICGLLIVYFFIKASSSISSTSGIIWFLCVHVPVTNDQDSFDENAKCIYCDNYTKFLPVHL